MLVAALTYGDVTGVTAESHIVDDLSKQGALLRFCQRKTSNFDCRVSL